jgi:two-component sensor histidine kinase
MIRPIVKVDWLPTIIRARLALGQTEAALGDFEQLLEAQETNFARNRANSLGIAEAQMRLSQRDGRIDFLEQEQELNRARLQTRTLIAVVAILSTVLLLGLSVFISRSYRNQTRVNAVLEESVSRNRERAQTAEQSLEHKSILINEIHHRVKNNFQTIISLLNTQRRQLGPSATEAAADILNDVSARVKTMAIVQQSLNSIEETDALNAHAFIDTLVVQLIEASGRPIRTNTDVDDVILQSEIAAPLALIIHELVSNTLKHAFAGPSGSLEIKLKENSGDELELTCADNGRGFPEGASIEAISSFGLTIIRDLTKQISGSVTFKNANPGMTCRITFPGRQAAVTS